jgi:hypothetical protein
MSKEIDAKKKEKINLINEVKTAKKALVKFRKENNLKVGDIPEDEKLAKTYKKLNGAIKTQEAALETVKAELKELTPKKTGGFAAKYDYPKVKDKESGEERDMTAKEKKAFRIKARNAAKKGDNAPEEKVVKTKKDKVEESAPSKKDETTKKKAKVETEDED